LTFKAGLRNAKEVFLLETEILKNIASYGVFAVLFFYLLWDSRKEHKQDKKDAREREETLMAHIQKSDEHIQKSDETLKEIAQKLQTVDTIKRDVEDIKQDIKELRG
jgi:type II secretory pathway component PulM